jgi:MFS family permease
MAGRRAGQGEAKQGDGRAPFLEAGAHGFAHLLCALVYFCLNAASYGVAFFLPTIIKNFGVSDTQTGLLAALPFVFGGIGMVLLGRHSDRTMERKGHVAVALLMATVGSDCRV